jgi:hypothetical protein
MVHRLLSIKGRVAQSVERWSNKPLVKGSSPFVTRFFCLIVGFASRLYKLHVAFVAERLRRYVQVVVTFGGVGSSPTECNSFFFCWACNLQLAFCAGYGFAPLTAASFTSTLSCLNNLEPHKAPHEATQYKNKRIMAVPGFEPGSSGSQPLMLTTTLYHHCIHVYGKG